MNYRQAFQADFPTLAQIRAVDSHRQEFWQTRISGYWQRTHHPQQALLPRIIYVAVDEGIIAGLIAGHLTQRYGCSGELQWIDVIQPYRGTGVALGLLQQLAAWFAVQQAVNVCVNCAADNLPALKFYKRHGAEQLNEHWLVWKDITTVLSQ